MLHPQCHDSLRARHLQRLPTGTVRTGTHYGTWATSIDAPGTLAALCNELCIRHIISHGSVLRVRSDTPAPLPLAYTGTRAPMRRPRCPRPHQCTRRLPRHPAWYRPPLPLVAHPFITHTCALNVPQCPGLWHASHILPAASVMSKLVRVGTGGLRPELGLPA
jgi:hypothetical protein